MEAGSALNRRIGRVGSLASSSPVTMMGPPGEHVGVADGTDVDVAVAGVPGVLVAGAVVTVGVGVLPPAVHPGNLKAPIWPRQPRSLVVGIYSLTYQKVQSSVGSTCNAV